MIVERDELLEKTNQRAAMLESHLLERERTIVERDAQLATQIARSAEEIAAFDATERALRTEIERRGGLRWWLALPYVRLRRALKPESAGTEQREA